MQMKKTLAVAVLVTGLGLAGINQASAAKDWGGTPAAYGSVPCPCGGQGVGISNQLDAATKAKIEKFREDTLDLRRQTAMKRAEKKALMQSQTPDATAVARVTGELFDLRETMKAKAELAGVSEYVGREIRERMAQGKRYQGRRGTSYSGDRRF